MCCCRYHCDVADQRLAQYIDKGNEDGLLISSVASCSNLWALIMDSGTVSPLKFTNSLPHLSTRGSISLLWQLREPDGQLLCPVVELDLLYPSKGMHKRWAAGYRITLTASTSNQAAFVLSIREENLQMIHKTHFALLCFLAHMSRQSVGKMDKGS
ncbi:hypothetical protein Hdeb2414_s0002g00080821 [Helianthus debilis subsp. tardiflorus]